MSSSRYLMSTLFACGALLLGGCATESEMPTEMAAAPAPPPGNTITGEGLPNPTAMVMENWGNLPDGREWGSTAGIDIDPNDGQIWAYERCGAGAFGGGEPINCDSNPVDPIFKFDRNTGEVLANFGGGVMVTPHGIHVDADSNVWVTDFAVNQAGDQGASGPQVQRHGRAAAEPRHGGPAGERLGPL